MAQISYVDTNPGQANFKAFLDFPKRLYGADWSDSTNYQENKYLSSCHLLLNNAKVVGRFAVYENEQLFFNGMKSVCLGSYECIEDSATANALISYAKIIAHKLGYEYMIGPMNGSTWNAYRFKLNSHRSSFLLESIQKEYYSHQFEFGGFENIAKYCSNLDEKLDFDPMQLDKFEKHYQSKGATIRGIDLNNLHNELLGIAELCNHAFNDNFLFTPIEPNAFVSKYAKIASLFSSKLIQIIEDENGDMHAFLFAINDFKDPTGKTLIIKTMAIRPNSKFKGVATYLGRKTIQIAKEMGYTRIIHAFIRKGNISELASKKFNQNTYREYALYGMKLKCV